MDKFGIPSASKHTWVEIMEVWLSMVANPSETQADKNFAIKRLMVLAFCLDEMDNAKKD